MESAVNVLNSPVLTEEKLVELLAEEAQKTWAERKEPCLLSVAVPTLLMNGFNYREVTGAESLSKWSSTVSQDKFEVVRHPIMKAKVGIIPKGEFFQYPETESIKPSNDLDGANARRDRYRKPVVVRFLESLEALTEEERASIVLPVNVIAKLMKQ